MASISELLGQLRNPSTDGKKSRQIIINILNAMNSTGLNASSLNGYTSDYFVSASDFRIKMEPYLKKIGMVNDLDACVDKNGTLIGVNYKYTGNNGNAYSPFGPNKLSTSAQQGQATSTTSFSLGDIEKPAFTMSFATSNAVYQKLGYSDLNDLQSKIRG